ncbi:MAG: hypothetical protein OXC07_06610 [Kistimonas sp.]|nr:hypothetical protein [Kistimonas sp.]
MIPTLSTTYKTLARWHGDCDTLARNARGRCLIAAGEDGHLKAGAVSSGWKLPGDKPLVLQQDFDRVPPDPRFHVLPQGDPEVLAAVQPARVRSTGRDDRVASMKAVAYPPEAPPPQPALAKSKKALFDNLLKQITKDAPALEMTRDRLLNLLRNPMTGEYDLLDTLFPAYAVIRYIQLQQVRPDFFPDADFYMAYSDQDVKLYSNTLGAPAANSLAFQDWVSHSAEKMEASRAARHAMKQWSPLLKAFMPEHEAFQDYLKEKIPEKHRLAAITEDELAIYKSRLEKDLSLHLKVFGPDQMNKDVLEHIFRDCCERLLMRCVKGYELSKYQYDKYRLQDFDWLDRDKHSYFFAASEGYFIRYYDAAIFGIHRQNPGGAEHKFRINLHPHDYVQAWPLVAEILHRNDCPFPHWKSTYPWQSLFMSQLKDTRLHTGGQFTLYCLAQDRAQEEMPPRCRQAGIARILSQIENRLHKAGIRPGARPFTDLACGQAYVSYRYQKDETRQKYEDARWVTHDRLRAYTKESCYQNVSRLLDQEATRQHTQHDDTSSSTVKRGGGADPFLFTEKQRRRRRRRLLQLRHKAVQ